MKKRLKKKKQITMSDRVARALVKHHYSYHHLRRFYKERQFLDELIRNHVNTHITD